MNNLTYALVVDVLRTPTCFILRVFCPFCKKLHKHGGGSGDKPHFGSRVAHCCDKEYELIEEAI